jgi:biotin carboxylase
VPAAAQPELHASARDLVARALALLGLTDGAFHVELFRTVDGWVFSEAAMRVGGRGIALHHETVVGVDLHEAMARAQIGAALSGGPGCNEAGDTYTGWTSLPGPAGTVRGYAEREDALKAPGVLDVEFDIAVGQRLGPSTADSVARVGSAILTAPSEHEYLKRQADLVRWFRSTVHSDQ